MSDVMLLGVLRMPMDFPFDKLTHVQVVSRCREAAERIEATNELKQTLRTKIIEGPGAVLISNDAWHTLNDWLNTEE